MEGQDTTAAVYSEAKSEYTKQLVFNFQPVLLRFFLDRYNESKTAGTVTSKAKSALSEFQDSLSQIPEWNIDKVQRETGILLESVHCDYIEDLITAVFIAHTKILSAIRLHAKPRRRIQITVPKPDHFMHRAMSECSRLLWSNVYLFNDSTSSLDRQKNMTGVNQFLEEGILQAIRNLLPVKSILRDSLQEDEDDGIQITNQGFSDVAEKDTNKKVEIDEEDVTPETPVISKAPEAVETVETVETPKPIEPLEPLEPVQLVKLLEPIEPLESVESVIPKLDVNSNTLFVDTERSVGFTGVDSVFGDSGHAELRPMIDEGDGDLRILGESEELDFDDIEDLDVSANSPPVALSADDYESL
jgi:hypothetical protein